MVMETLRLDEIRIAKVACKADDFATLSPQRPDHVPIIVDSGSDER